MRTLSSKLFQQVRVLLLVGVMLCAFFVGVVIQQSRAASCGVWYHCPVTQRYGQNYEHGVDLWTQGLVITALLSGTITFDHAECWSGECVQDITWHLDRPVRGVSYAYVQILRWSTFVHVGQHVWVGTPLGRSGGFIEFGFNRFPAYGVAPYPWLYSGVNPLSVFPWL